MSDDYRNTREHAALFDVSERGKVVVSGPDARSFLHNLSTNDIKGLQVGAGCEAFFATAQARAVAHALIYCVQPDGQDSFWLDLEPGLAEKVVRHLDRFIISEQVELADRTQEFGQFHLAGPEARGVVDRVAGVSNLPEANLQHVAIPDFAGVPCQVRRHDPLGVPGYDILCPREQIEVVRRALIDAGARPSRPETYEVLRVEAGTPVYGVDIDDNRLVMEVGRIAQAICYTKGCYLGQEPIVMARDRGHINRTLLGLNVRDSGPLPRDTKLFREGKEVGQVTSSVVSPRFGTIALAYIRRGNQEPGTGMDFEIGGVKGTALVTSLPFST